MNYTITLADGRKLEGLTRNGSNFVSQTKVDEAVFRDHLSTMTVFDGTVEQTYHNVELIQQVQYADGWYLAFREKSTQELKEMELNAQILALTEAMVEMQFAQDLGQLQRN